MEVPAATLVHFAASPSAILSEIVATVRNGDMGVNI